MNEALVKGKNTPEPGLPKSFNVLIKELQSCLFTISLSNLCYGLLASPDFDKQFEKSDILVVGYVEKTDFIERIDKDGKLMSSDYSWWVHTFIVENVLKGEDEEKLKNIYILDREKGGFDAPVYIRDKRQLLFLAEVKLSDTEKAEYRLLVVTEDKSSNKKSVELKELLEGKYFETPFWRNGTIILDDDKLESKKISDEAKEFIEKIKNKKKEKQTRKSYEVDIEKDYVELPIDIVDKDLKELLIIIFDKANVKYVFDVEVKGDKSTIHLTEKMKLSEILNSLLGSRYKWWKDNSGVYHISALGEDKK